jgi:uncharacterized YccA/Bax inhibitor family protein
MAGGSFPPPHPGGAFPPPPRPGSGGTLRRQGVASATAVLLAIIAVVGVVGWNLVTTRTEVGLNAQGQVVEQTTADIPAWVIGALFVGLGLVIVTFFKPMWARVTAPIYAVAEGLLIGAISKVYEVRFEGIVLQAVGLTIGVFTMMLVLYATGRIRVTPRLRLGIIAATGGIALIYLATWVMRLFGGDMPFIHGTGGVGIAFSLVVVVIAALNLTLDFDFVDRAEQAGAPRQLEWFAALGLVVTLVWLYLELLRLLGKLRSR